MYRVVFYVVISAMILISKPVAAELTWGFKSPAFHHGNGYSSHVLSVEQLQHNRKQDLKDKADAEARRLERELENNSVHLSDSFIYIYQLLFETACRPPHALQLYLYIGVNYFTPT